MPSTTTENLALLVDADNAQATVITELLSEVASYGTATVKRAYGDWTTPNLVGWKDVLHIHAIQPIQQFRYTTGKNATDSALIIDAMDLLHGGKVDGFCLVSSDSDFTRFLHDWPQGLEKQAFRSMVLGSKKLPNRLLRLATNLSTQKFFANPPPKRLSKYLYTHLSNRFYVQQFLWQLKKTGGPY